MDKNSVLKEYFGYFTFREGQEELIDAILNKKDVLGIMPTGAGKSVCFQVPALIFPGVTIVVSPLVSLMKDQVNSLLQCGIKAAFINATLTEKQHELVMERAEKGAYKIIYVAPERLQNKEFVSLCHKIDISMVCVDEAHCVSHWGHDFRPSYLHIKSFIGSLEKRPVVAAFTATATKRVREDVTELIGLYEPFEVVTGFDRPNLYFEVVKPKNKYVALRRYLDLYSGRNGIVYCASRRNTDELYEKLSEEGYSVTKYHAGLPKAERDFNQELFINDKKEVIIATNAFGMGIDKSNVSFIVHYNMPGDIESYYQEAGRAGRDGSDAECILLFSPSDIRLQKYFIENSEDNSELSEKEKEEIRELRLEKLNKMVYYSTNAPCLRNYMLSYFGERPRGRCQNCSGCNGSGTSVDITLEAQKIFSCIKRVKEKEKKEVIIDILKGNSTDYIVKNKLDKVKTFGVMSDVAESQIEKHIKYFLDHSFISENSKGNLVVEDKAYAVLFKNKRLRRFLEKTDKYKTAENPASEVDLRLLTKLKILRKDLASKSSVPAFIIFTDATLIVIATLKPMNKQEFLKIAGVSERKFDKYGPAFIKLIYEHCNKTVEKSLEK
ncbi:MAG: DNA helicase RecQ [Clostridia bacterium]|nr:DNA helicase RecQ [Clostridia bacterium]